MSVPKLSRTSSRSRLCRRFTVLSFNAVRSHSKSKQKGRRTSDKQANESRTKCKCLTLASLQGNGRLHFRVLPRIIFRFCRDCFDDSGCPDVSDFRSGYCMGQTQSRSAGSEKDQPIVRQVYVPIKKIVSRVRSGEPLRWVPCDVLGLPATCGDNVLMLGGTALSYGSWTEIFDSKLFQESEDSVGVLHYELKFKAGK